MEFCSTRDLDRLGACVSLRPSCEPECVRGRYPLDETRSSRLGLLMDHHVCNTKNANGAVVHEFEFVRTQPGKVTTNDRIVPPFLPFSISIPTIPLCIGLESLVVGAKQIVPNCLLIDLPHRAHRQHTATISLRIISSYQLSSSYLKSIEDKHQP